MGAMSILITGAGGFVGRHAVAAARARGHVVRALVRREASVPQEWQNDPGITPVILDLGAVTAEDLAARLSGLDAVIHAAVGMGGDDAGHARDTIKPTETLIAAFMALSGSGSGLPKLVLVSSLSVYGGQGLSAGSKLEEDSPLEAHPEARDSYCRAKLMQERLCRTAAEAMTGLDLCILRPGAIIGLGRLWNGHLGHPVGPMLIRLESRGEVPVCQVEQCASALILAAEAPAGSIDTLNVIDPDRPSRAAYIKALRAGGWPRFVVPLPWRVLSGVGSLLGMLGLGSRLPGLLRPATLHSRMKPMQYDTTRLQALPGWHPGPPFSDYMAATLAKEAQ